MQATVGWAPAWARKIGDKLGELRCLTYLGYTAVRRRDTQRWRSWRHDAKTSLCPWGTRSTRELLLVCSAGQPGSKAGRPTWSGSRTRHWKDRDRSVMHYPLYSLCLWPLVAARLASGRVVDAAGGRASAVTPSQHRLPEELEALVQGASIPGNKENYA